MQPSDVTIADIYEKTAEVLETEGWVQGDFYSNDPRFGTGYCAIGGMKRASVLLELCGMHSHKHVTKFDHPKLQQAVQILEDYLGEEVCITEWNDEEVQSANEVIDTFKHLAKDIRNGELE